MTAEHPSEPPSRDDNETTTPRSAACPVCAARFTPIRRQAYRSHRCRQVAWRRRRSTSTQPPLAPAASSRRRHTIYTCPDCDTRYLEHQWCPHCNRPCRRLGHGGECSDCDALLTVTELLNLEPPMA